MSLHIYPLVAGWVDNDIRTFDPGEKPSQLHAPVLFWAIMLDGLNLLFDTGASDPDLAAQRGRTNYHRNKNEEPLAQLRSIGLQSADIAAVVLSHLHWDHASNWQLFPHAPVYVQTTELNYAVAPDLTNSRYFDTIASPPAAIPGPTVRAIDGTALVLDDPRLKLVPLPGHTPGSQGLLIREGSASVLLAGDTVPLLSNLAGTRPRANGIATDAVQAQTTIERVPDLASDVLPSHDPILVGRCGQDIVNDLAEIRMLWKSSNRHHLSE